MSSVELTWRHSGASFQDKNIPAEHLVLTLKTEGANGKMFAVEVTIFNEQSSPVFFCAPHLVTPRPPPLHRAGNTIQIDLQIPALAGGRYYLSLQFVNPLVEVYSHYGMVAQFMYSPPDTGLHGWSFIQARNQGCVLLNGTSKEV